MPDKHSPEAKEHSNYQRPDAFAAWQSIGSALEQPTETSIADILPAARAVTAATLAAMEEVARLSPLAHHLDDYGEIATLTDATAGLSGTLYGF